jgi:hypothetical protein
MSTSALIGVRTQGNWTSASSSGSAGPPVAASYVTPPGDVRPRLAEHRPFIAIRRKNAMMSEDPRNDYRDAMKRHDEARTKATAMIALIRRAADSFSSYKLPTTLAANFNISSPGFEGRYSRDVAWRVDAWPDQKAMREIFQEWNAAFNSVHEAWSRIPHEDRAVIRKPPEKMETD